ncbi:MAG: malto-oligosyltrehalose trehalohydrolase [Candidatus Tectomicrobia bacterium]|nr:malto-oligosyltrehalose trehalohydrolase [Candidatus Tectomicrobia bacterium]
MEAEEGRALGARDLGGGRCRFRVWAPSRREVQIHLLAPRERVVPLAAEDRGYHSAVVEGVEPGSLYRYRLGENREFPDPASRSQPQGVHGPSQVVDSRFAWGDGGWKGLPIQDYILYEVHVGAFTPDGTFDAVLPRLNDLEDLGVTAVELMPVAQFPGSRNWGYDGVFPFAVQHSYGGPQGLKRLVNACHGRGIAVVLDVVYNHVGPEGNCLGEFGPYFTNRYRTPWGPALNFDGPHSDEVRRYFIENALTWIGEFHVDALRLDAVHAICDFSAKTFLEELSEAVSGLAERLGRQVFLIPENDRNDPRFVAPPEEGGCGLDAVWSEDFHHALHALLTGEAGGYYRDFGSLGHLERAFAEGFAYTGQYSAYRGRRHGRSAHRLPARRHVVFAQNHDQVGNRGLGERLGHLVSFEKLKLAAGTVLLSPYVPLLFMGEEYGEPAPFLYFVHHSDPELIEAVRRGRREESARFRWSGEPPDPQDEAAFLRSRLNWDLRRAGRHRVLLDLYTSLIRLRKEIPALARLSKDHTAVAGFERERVLFVRRWSGESRACAIFHFGGTEVSLGLPIPPGRWRRRLDSEEERWLGRGSLVSERLHSGGEVALTLRPAAFVLLSREEDET